VVPYGPLDKVALRVVVEHALEDLLSRRGIRRGHVLVDVEPELLQMLVEQAFDPRYGARPLRRALERRLTVPLAHHLVTRRGDDLALVELYRRGQDLGLGVRLLADAAPLPAGEDPGTWSLARLAAAVDEAGVALRRLAASPAAKALAEPLAQLQVRVDELALEDLEATVFGEEEDQPIKKALRWAVDRRDVGHGGLRQRQGFRDVPLEHNAEPTLKRVRPMVARVRDELAVLTHRLAAAETRGDEALTLLFECVGVPSIEALETARWMAPTRIARHTRWEEVGEAGGAAWSAHEGVITRKPALRRIAYAFSGPGLRELLAPLAGWVLVEIVQGGLPLTVPVRVDLCEGEGAEAIAARDARVRAERERRRAAAVTEPLEPGVIVARQRERGGALWHLASGRAASDHEGVAAALLRAGAGAGRADGG
jgi:ATP-dependent Clp protease ATP-binding subunit ClpC